jgi:hypothetical protein
MLSYLNKSFQNPFSFYTLPTLNQVAQLFQNAYLTMLHVTVAKRVWVVLDTLDGGVDYALVNDQFVAKVVTILKMFRR